MLSTNTSILCRDKASHAVRVLYLTDLDILSESRHRNRNSIGGAQGPGAICPDQ